MPRPRPGPDGDLHLLVPRARPQGLRRGPAHTWGQAQGTGQGHGLQAHHCIASGAPRGSPESKVPSLHICPQTYFGMFFYTGFGANTGLPGPPVEYGPSGIWPRWNMAPARPAAMRGLSAPRAWANTHVSRWRTLLSTGPSSNHSRHEMPPPRTPEEHSMGAPRPARLQVDADAIPDDDRPPQTGHTFNVWYLKWAGGDAASRGLERLRFRVDIGRDAGTTRGVDGASPICLFFARGCCYKGRKCPYLHRAPRASDRRVPTQDCFGRDLATDDRDDMAGPGLLRRRNRTLYVAGAHMGDHTHAELHRQFLEFGAIDAVRVLPAKLCAFVSFRLEAEAQFAREAMDGQTLDGKDVLTVKWANEDPSPHAQQHAQRDLEAAALETVQRLLGGSTRKRGAEREAPVPEVPRSNGPGPDEAAPAGILGLARASALKRFKGGPQKAPQRAPQQRSPVASGGKTGPCDAARTATQPAFLAGYSSSDDSS